MLENRNFRLLPTPVIIISGFSLTILSSCHSQNQGDYPLTENDYSNQSNQTLTDVADILADVEGLDKNANNNNGNDNNSNSANNLPPPPGNLPPVPASDFPSSNQSSSTVNIPQSSQGSIPSTAHQYQNVDINVVESGHSNISPGQAMQQTNQVIENAASAQQGNSLIINKNINLDNSK